MKKKLLELGMGILLLVCFLALSKEAATVTGESVKGTILVDAGHGGRDPGMVGIDGLEEKDLNLAIAGKLRVHLENEGYHVVMTREKDEGLYQENAQNRKQEDMQKRCELISSTSPLLSVSIHQNSYNDPQVKGPQVFYYEHSVQGEKLASCIQEQMNIQLQVENPRSVKSNGSYYLLKKSEGVLNIVECGFLTNPEEAEKLQTEEYQEQIAKAITDGILQYLNTD